MSETTNGKNEIRLVSPINYMIRGEDDILNIDTTGGITTLHIGNITTNGLDLIRKRIYINDITGNASVNNITINTIGGDTINGLIAFVLDVDGISAEIVIVDKTRYLANLSGDTGGGGGGITSVTATTPITSSGGATPNVSTSISTNRLVGRGTAGTGAMEEIILGTNLSLTGTTLNAVGGGGGGVSSVTATAPISSSGGVNPDISISQSGVATNGFLTSIDWNTFNNKGIVNSVTASPLDPIIVNNIDPANPVISSGLLLQGLTATSPITSSGGVTPVISTSIATNRLVGRGTAGTGAMEEIILGTNLSLTGTTLNSTNSGGSVTNVSALTLGTSGADLSSSVATSTTTPIITLNVPTASALNRGALSSADWTTFNNKGSGTITNVTATTPITSSGGVTPVISTSIATNRLVGRGTAGTGAMEEIILGTNLSLTGTTLNATGGVSGVTSVTATAPISSSGGATPDISISQSGVATNGFLTSIDWNTFNNKGSGTITSVSGTLNKIDSTGGTTPIIDISAFYVGQTSITTLGTIGTGVWNGTTIAIANGGTGQITATLGFNALSPVTTRGDIIVRGVTDNVRLALGTAGRILRSDGTDLVYTTATYPTTTTINTLLYSSSANVISDLATANSGILVTSATGVPSISAQLTYVTTTGFFTNTLSINSAIQISAVNSNTGNATFIQVLANNGTYNFALQQLGTGYATNGLLVANQSRLASSSISSMLINTSVASVPIIFAIGGFTASNEAHRSTTSGIEFRVLLKSLVHSAANLMAGQITLIGGTLAIAIAGLTTSHRGMVTLVTPNNVFATRTYQAVCTANTLTIQANTDTGLLNMADTSVLNYFIFLSN